MDCEGTETGATEAGEGLAEPGDGLLLTLARMVDGRSRSDADFGIGITVLVEGQVLSGVMVGPRRWLAELATLSRAASGAAQGQGDFLASLAATFERVGDVIYGSQDEEAPVGYLHLLNARPLLPHWVGPGIPFRVAASRVSGWTLGEVPAPRVVGPPGGEG